MPHRVLLGVADPAQPLWHYAVDSRSRSWWRRARKVAEDTCLSPEARAIALRTARDHALIRHPDQLKPPPAETERGKPWRGSAGTAATEAAEGRLSCPYGRSSAATPCCVGGSPCAGTVLGSCPGEKAR